MTAAQPHLSIQGKIISWKLSTALHHATSSPPYQQYLQEKHNWTECDMSNIHWEVMTMALSYFPQEDQWQLVLFLNNKLPLCASKMHPHHGSMLCPSCLRNQEDSHHFL